MINWPDAPTPGQVFNSGTGPIYIWDGVAWNLATSQTRTARSKNLVGNPAMEISQENGSTGVTTTGGYPADMWTLSVTGLTVSAARSAITTFGPDNSPYGIIFGATTAKGSLAAGDWLQMRTYIEGANLGPLEWGTPSAQQAVLRFNFWNGGAQATYAASINNGAADRSWVANFVAPVGWSTQTFVVPGDVTGTWPKDNSRGMILNVSTAVGPTYLTSAQGWSAGVFFGGTGMSNGAASVQNFYLGDVGLYPDPEKTGLPPPFIAPKYSDALIDCVRYWKKLATTLTGGCVATGSPFYTEYTYIDMRTTPSVSFANVSYSNANSLAVNGGYPNHLRLSATGAGGASNVPSYAVADVLLNARM